MTITRRVRRLLALPSGLLLAVVTGSAAAGRPGPAPVLETRTLCGFESPADIAAFFRTQDWRDVRLAGEHVREGSACALVRAASGRGLFKAWLPPESMLDASGWDVVRFWANNPGARRAQLGFALHDADGHAVAPRKLFVGPQSGRWVDIPVATLRQNGVDPARLRKVMISLNPPRVRGAPVEGRDEAPAAMLLYIDALQLAAWRQPLDALRRDIATNAQAYAAALQDNPAQWIEETADRLAQAGTLEAARVLVGGLSTPRSAYLCTEALMRMDAAVIRPALAEALTSGSANARRLGCAVIGSQGDAAAASIVAPLLHDDDHYVRHFAAEALADLSWAGCEADLLVALDDAYPMVRLNAARALARAQTNRAAVVAALTRRVTDPAAGVNAIRALTVLQAREAVPALVAALANGADAWEAGKALSVLGGPDATDGVTAVVRGWGRPGTLGGRAVQAVVRTAGQLGCADAGDALEAIAEQSPDAAVRYDALRALGQLGRTSPAARAVRDDPSPLVRMAAARVLAADPHAAMALRQSLRDLPDASLASALGVRDTGTSRETRFDGGPQAPADEPLPAPDAAFSLFIRRPELVVTNTARPEMTDARERVDVMVAGDEAICIQIGVHARRDLVQVHLRPPKGLPMAPTLYVLDDREGQAVLVEGDALRWLPAGYSRAFWLTARVPAGTPPGLYTNSLTVDADGDSVSLPLKLTVLPFTLPDLDEPMHILYSGELTADVLREDPSAIQTAGVVYRDMAAHGMNAACPTPELRYREGESGLPDVSLLTAGMALAASGGLRYPREFFFVGNPLSVNKRKWTAPWVNFRAYYHPKRVQRLAYELEQRAPGRSALYLVDEPTLRDTSQDGVARNRMAALLYAKAKEVPGAYTAMTGSEEDFDALGDDVDLWVFGGAPRIDQAEDAMNRGARVASYGGPRHPLGDGFSLRAKFGAYTWRSGEFGQSLWTYPGRLCATVGPDGTVPYPAWECVRLGVDDLRYLRLLESLARRDPDGRARAGALVRSLNAALHPERDDPSWSRVDPALVRAAVVEVLMAAEWSETADGVRP
ncbi:MAG: HEAT repeat domain-containing protein [Lentisphaerae bacterium]|nr:HEAT repeat domain-containing protein [Lentisphaerota bacterium]